MNLQEAAEHVQQLSHSHRLINRIRKGLEILEKYYDDVSVTAEHDQVWGWPQHGTPQGFDYSLEDVEALGELGWFVDSDIDGWTHFV